LEPKVPNKEKQMSKLIVFIQVHGRPGVLEAELSAAVTLGELHDALAAAGVALDNETLIFVDEAEDHLSGDRHNPIHGLKYGCRIHICRCKHIRTTVQYLERAAEHDFPPGARVRAVKEWAVHKFELTTKDAAEHVLQLCKSTDRPSSDTPLHQLVGGHDHHHQHEHGGNHDCRLCFDLVPDKRVEG
jgi:hypothetical protein